MDDAELAAGQGDTTVVAGPMDHLSSYFRDLSGYTLLAPEQESDMARAIEDCETTTWQHLLANPSLTEYLLDLIANRMDNSIDGFRGLRQTAAKARKTRTKAMRDKLEKTAREIAIKIRALDLDREHIEAVLRHLTDLRADTPATRATKLPFSQHSRAFVQCLENARACDAQATRIREDFVRANLRLVVTMARRYDHGSMPLADLIQEGNLGLMHAVSRFDYRRGLRFSTYACWWIRHAIGRALADKARTVRIPVHMLEAQAQLQKVRDKLTREFGRKPTYKELATEANVPIAKVEQMHRYLMGQPLSLDRPAHDNDDRNLGDVLPDPESEDIEPEDRLAAQALVDRVFDAMCDLSPIEIDVLRQRFGLRDDEERTFREIGDQYHLSRERIRQIQNTALGKLREALQNAV